MRLDISQRLDSINGNAIACRACVDMSQQNYFKVVCSEQLSEASCLSSVPSQQSKIIISIQRRFGLDEVMKQKSLSDDDRDF